MAKALKRLDSRRALSQNRKGAAAVEFALVAPILFLVIILPLVEFGRALIANELVANAARAGCRVAVLRGTDNATINSTVNTALSSQGISGGATITVLVNGSVANASTANQGDTISVTVAIPYNNVSWLPTGTSYFMKNKTLATTHLMRRE